MSLSCLFRLLCAAVAICVCGCGCGCRCIVVCVVWCVVGLHLRVCICLFRVMCAVCQYFAVYVSVAVVALAVDACRVCGVVCVAWRVWHGVCGVVCVVRCVWRGVCGVVRGWGIFACVYCMLERRDKKKHIQRRTHTHMHTHIHTHKHTSIHTLSYTPLLGLTIVTGIEDQKEQLKSVSSTLPRWTRCTSCVYVHLYNTFVPRLLHIHPRIASIPSIGHGKSVCVCVLGLATGSRPQRTQEIHRWDSFRRSQGSSWKNKSFVRKTGPFSLQGHGRKSEVLLRHDSPLLAICTPDINFLNRRNQQAQSSLSKDRALLSVVCADACVVVWRALMQGYTTHVES